MADAVTYSRIVETLDNRDFIANLSKAEQAERDLAAIRELAGKAGVKAYNATEAAQKKQATAAAQAARQQEADYARLFAAQESFTAKTLALQERTAGLSSEQRELNGFIRQAEAAYKAGTITANQYADAVAVIKQRQAQISTAKAPTQVVASLEAIGKTSSATSAGLQRLSFQVNDVFTSLASGAPVTQVFAQQGGQIFQAFQSAPGLMGALAAGIGSVGTALAVGLLPFLSVAGPLYLDYQAGAEAAAAGQDALNQALEEGEPLYDRALSDLRALNELANASATAEERKARATQEYTDTLSAANATLRASIEDNQAWLATHGPATAGWLERTKAIEAANAEMRENERRSAAGLEAATILIDYQEEEARSSRALAEAKKREAAARKANAEAEREFAEARRASLAIMDADTAATQQAEQSIAALAEITRKAQESELDGLAKLDAARQRQIEQIEAAFQAGTQAAAGDATRQLALVEETERAKTAITAQYIADRTALEREAADAAIAEAQRVADERAAMDRAALDSLSASIGAAADLSSTFSDRTAQQAQDAIDLQAAALEAAGMSTEAAKALALEQTRAQQVQAQEAWRRTQTLAISSATVQAALAVATALATPPAPNFLAAAAAGLAGAGAVAKVATVPPPTFTDTPPGGWRPEGGSRTATFAPDDTVIAARDPRELIRQAVAATVDRQMARPPTRTQSSAARNATTPTARLLTSDLSRVVRGRA